MGGFQCAGMGKSNKVIENSPLLAFKPEWAQRMKLKNSYLLSEMANFDY
jgi:hypothetical protein